MVYKALKGLAPSYLTSLLTYHTPLPKLRSSEKKFILNQPRYKLHTMGRRAFSIAGPTLWNSLPDDVRNVELSVDQFKKKLKTYLFEEHFVSEQKAH